MTKLNYVTQELGESYDQWKHSEKTKNGLRDDFFKLVTEEIKKETPAQVLEQVQAKTAEEARASAAKSFPRFTILDVLPDGEGQYRVAMEENPELRSFSFVNQEDGRVYTKQVVDASPVLDDESLRVENPELWDEITETIQVLKPLAQLTPEQLVQVGKYVFMPKPTVKLAAPRKARPEELDEDDIGRS